MNKVCCKIFVFFMSVLTLGGKCPMAQSDYLHMYNVSHYHNINRDD